VWTFFQAAVISEVEPSPTVDNFLPPNFFSFPGSKRTLFTEFESYSFSVFLSVDPPIICVVSRCLTLQACFCYPTEMKDLLTAKVANASVARTVFLLNMTLISRKLMLINVIDMQFQLLPTSAK